MRIRGNIWPFLALILCALMIARFCQAVDPAVNKSTNCINASTLFIVPNVFPGCTLGSVFINTRSSGPETLKIYDSSGVASNLIGTIDLSTGTTSGSSVSDKTYNLRISSSITFSKSGSGADATITYQIFRGL